MNFRKTDTGFTAFELLISMAVIAIILALAVPSFKNYGWNLRMKTALDSLQTDLNLARGRAISLNIQTVVCPVASPDTNASTNNAACADNSIWQAGWMVFADLNGDRDRQAGEPLLKQTTAVEFIHISSSSSRSKLRFYPNGSAPGSNASILFCDQRGSAYAGKLILSNTGRIRTRTGGTKPTKDCP